MAPAPAPSGVTGLFTKSNVYIGMGLGAVLIVLCNLLALVNSGGNPDIARLAGFLRSLGLVAIFVSSMTGGVLLPEQNNYVRLGYFIIAAFAVQQI